MCVRVVDFWTQTESWHASVQETGDLVNQFLRVLCSVLGPQAKALVVVNGSTEFQGSEKERSNRLL